MSKRNGQCTREASLNAKQRQIKSIWLSWYCGAAADSRAPLPVLFAPSRMAPRNSKMEATTTACQYLSALADTEVPKAVGGAQQDGGFQQWWGGVAETGQAPPCLTPPPPPTL